MKIKWLGKKKLTHPFHLCPGDNLTCVWPTSAGYKSFTRGAARSAIVNKVGIFEAEDWGGFKCGIGGFFGEEDK